MVAGISGKRKWNDAACKLTHVLLVICARSCRDIICRMTGLLSECFQLTNAEMPWSILHSETSTWLSASPFCPILPLWTQLQKRQLSTDVSLACRQAALLEEIFFFPLQAAKVDSLAPAIDWMRLQFPHQFHNTQKASIYIIVCSAGQQLPGNLKLFWFQLTRTAAIELAGIAIDKLMIFAFYFFDQWVTAGATVTSVSKETVQANISNFSSYIIYIYILYRERHSHHSFVKCTCKQNVCLCF